MYLLVSKKLVVAKKLLFSLLLMGCLAGCNQPADDPGTSTTGDNTGSGSRAESDVGAETGADANADSSGYRGIETGTEARTTSDDREIASRSTTSDAGTKLSVDEQQAGLEMSQSLSTEPDRLEVRDNDTFGAYIVDSNGRALYMFKADSSNPSRATCVDACVADWPPMIVKGEVETRDGVNQDLVGQVQHPGGGTQATYGGWPLYYFQKDASGLTLAGQDLESHGAEWYLVSPEGKPIEDDAE